MDDVLASATTAMAQLMVGGQPSPQALIELNAALGIRTFVAALAIDSDNDHVDGDETTAAVAELMGALFTGGPIVARLTASLDAPAPVVAAASRLVAGLWAVIYGTGALGPIQTTVPAPTGDNPHMHTIAVAWMLEHLCGKGIDIAPLLQVGAALEVIDEPTARVMTDAATTLQCWQNNPVVNSPR